MVAAIPSEILLPRAELANSLREADVSTGNVVPLRAPVGILQDQDTHDIIVLFGSHRWVLPAIGHWPRTCAWVNLHALKRAVVSNVSEYVTLRLEGAELRVDNHRVVVRP